MQKEDNPKGRPSGMNGKTTVSGKTGAQDCNATRVTRLPYPHRNNRYPPEHFLRSAFRDVCAPVPPIPAGVQPPAAPMFEAKRTPPEKDWAEEMHAEDVPPFRSENETKGQKLHDGRKTG